MTGRSRSGPRPTAVAWVGWTLMVLVVGAAAFVAGRASLSPPQAAVAGAQPLTVAVAEATVGRSIPMNVVATWARADFGAGAAEGVLTSVDVEDGARIGPGDLLYTVDLRPVVAGEGRVPPFRDLSAGARGADVRQLQALLQDVGHLPPDMKPDGVFGSSTTRAVRAWQKALALPDDGTVRASDIVYAARLPARVSLTPEAVAGVRLTGGESVLSILGAAPGFAVTLASGTLPPDDGESLEVIFDDEPVPAIVERTSLDAQQAVVLHLARRDGTPVCGNACADVPLDEASAFYPGRRVVVPEVTGPSVPAAAVRTDADGVTYLEREDGSRVPIAVVAEGDGRAVVRGIDVGMPVLLPDGNP